MDVERGVMGPLPYAAVGDGPPLVVLAGLSPVQGVDGDGLVKASIGFLASLARRKVVFNRRPGMPRGMTMADIAAEHAEAIEAGLGRADVLGLSTGGSVAQQLAADHPGAVDRLVLASTACRLGPQGKAAQRQVAARIRSGAPRKALAVGAAALAPRAKVLAGVTGALLGPLVTKGADLSDMATTIEAEDAFDLARLSPVEAPTLILAGAGDRFYSRALFEETARLIPSSELHVIERRGHVTVLNDARLRSALARFLSA